MLAGRYLLVDRIGAGGTGAVWRARDLRTGAWVAAKVLGRHDRRAAAALRPRAVACGSEHPHVLAPIGWAAEDDVVVLVTDAGARRLGRTTCSPTTARCPSRYVRVLLDQLLQGWPRCTRPASCTATSSRPTCCSSHRPRPPAPPARRLRRRRAAAEHVRRPRGRGLVGTDGYLAPERLPGRPGPRPPGRVRRRRGRRRAAHRPSPGLRRRRPDGSAPAAAGRR